jgi:hypothetical protein
VGKPTCPENLLETKGLAGHAPTKVGKISKVPPHPLQRRGSSLFIHGFIPWLKVRIVLD